MQAFLAMCCVASREDKRLEISSIEKFQFEAVHFTYPARPEVKARGRESTRK